MGGSNAERKEKWRHPRPKWKAAGTRKKAATETEPVLREIGPRRRLKWPHQCRERDRNVLPWIAVAKWLFQIWLLRIRLGNKYLGFLFLIRVIRANVDFLGLLAFGPSLLSCCLHFDFCCHSSQLPSLVRLSLALVLRWLVLARVGWHWSCVGFCFSWVGLSWSWVRWR